VKATRHRQECLCYTKLSALDDHASAHATGEGAVVAGKNVGLAPDAKIVAVRIIGDEAVWMKGMEAIINISGGVAFAAVPKFEAVMRKMIEGVDADGNPEVSPRPTGRWRLKASPSVVIGLPAPVADRRRAF